MEGNEAGQQRAEKLERLYFLCAVFLTLGQETSAENPETHVALPKSYLSLVCCWSWLNLVLART